MKKPLILIIDDEPDIRELVKDILQDEGYRVQLASCTREGEKCIEEEQPNMVFLDLWMPQQDGLSLLAKWKDNGQITFPVVVMSGHGTVDTATEAAKLGAYSFLEKPLTTAKLLQPVQEIFPQHINDPVHKPAGSSPIACQLIEDCTRAASDILPLWIAGNSGVGKVTLARYIDSLAVGVRNIPLVIECRDELDFEYTLTPDFPQKNPGQMLIFRQFPKLSFTEQDRVTKFIESISIKDVRRNKIVATGSKEPTLLQKQDAITRSIAKIFSAQTILLKPLHDRMVDIPEIVTATIDFLCQNEDMEYRRLSTAALNYLMHTPWLKNLKELEQVVRKLLKNASPHTVSLLEIQNVIFSMPDRYNIQDLFNRPLKEARDMFEKIYLEKKLFEGNGSITELSKETGLERTHLYRKLKNLNIKY